MNSLRAIRFLAALALLISFCPARASVDLDLDGVGDVWRLKYNNTQPGTTDTDGDGATNAQESAAGTDPNSPVDSMRVASIQLNGANVDLTWSGLPGKRYKVQATASLSPAGWADVTGFLNGVGADIVQSLPVATGKFFRVAVYDLDTDGDGVTDWEEQQLGLDPENDRSHGLSGLNDLAWVTAGLTTPSVVTVAAAVNEIAENSLYPTSFTVTRSGGFAPLTVNFAVSGGATPVTDYAALGTSVSIPLAAFSSSIVLTPATDVIVESPEAVIVTLTPHASYTVGQPGAAGILITDQTSATTGTGLQAQFWSEGATELGQGTTPTFTGALVSRIDPQLTYSWAGGEVPDPLNPTGFTDGYWSSRWTGEVLPQFSQIYTFSFETNMAGRVWVGGKKIIDNWPPATVVKNSSTDVLCVGVIELVAGRRYPVLIEHYQDGGTGRAHLRWQSASQVDPTSGLPNVLHVIPQSQLFPTVAPQITSGLERYTFIGGPAFNYQIVASANPTSYSVANLPPGLTMNAAGLISGNPAQAGEWQVVLGATNTVGTGSAILKLTVLQTGGGVVREQWDGVNGTSVAGIPTGLAPTSTSLLTSLQFPANAGESFGARTRGYFTAAATGTYTFWLSADHAAQLRISDDAEPVNAWLRAELTAPSSVAPDWSTAAKTEMLQLYAGRKYYFEVLHKEDTGDDNLAIGWAKPGESTAAPSEVIPGYVLTQYTPAAPIDGASTLYTTSMHAQGAAVTGGFGSGIIIMSADKTTLKLYYTHGNLTTGVVAKHLHSDADGGQIFYDIDTGTQDPDGGYTWNITPVAGITDKDGDSDSDAADIVKLIENGDAYINIHTAQYPAGEIRGNFRLAAGSQTFTPPPAPPSWTDDHTDYAAAQRFLTQATFGASVKDIEEVQALGYEGWIDAQFAKPTTLAYPYVFENRARTDTQGSTYVSNLMHYSWWKNAVTAQDQLRQKYAFALSEILVTSVADGSPLDNRADAVSDYYDMLIAGHLEADPNTQVSPVVSPVPKVLPGITGYDGSSTLSGGAFGNFRDILISVTLHPAMGRYLDMVRNDKPDITTGRIPNENYAREIKQLFSLGLNRLHPDGTLILDSKGLPIPTYDQEAIEGFSLTFTGWDWFYAGPVSTSSGYNAGTNYLEPMREVPRRHFTGQKRLLNNVVIPGLTTVNGLPHDPYGATNSGMVADPAFAGLAAQELLISHDKIFNHPNVPPFICRQLIQRMVTSTPSPGYIYRVVSAFNDNDPGPGIGARGDMKAVVKAILLDYEARSTAARQAIGYGKQREPIVRVTNVARAFPPQVNLAGTWAQDGGGITINTAEPHRLTEDQEFQLTFGDATPASGTPLAQSGKFDTSTLGGNFTMTPTSFAVRAKDCHRGTYAKAADTLTVTVTSGADHGLATSGRAYVRFRDGALSALSGLYPVTVTSTTVFTLDLPAGNEALATTGSPKCDISVMTGSYSLPRPTPPAITEICTITCNSEHGLTTGANIYIDFKIDTNNYVPEDGSFSVTYLDKYRFTVVATYPNDGAGNLTPPASVTTLSNQMVAAAEAPILDRGGHATGYALLGGYGDFTLGNTDTALGQTPMASPTVFNFYLPDYQYPGEIASAGLYTPEFQLTSDTTAIGQANFFYNGIFKPADYITGFSSFNNGGADIPMDFSPWMDIRPGSTFPWVDNDTADTANDNLRNFIREMSRHLMAGQMTAAMENEIYNYVTFRADPVGAPTTYTNINYTNGNTVPFATASTGNLTRRRDRVRAVIHLIVTSPEFAIQK